jgi:hypothetical protein
MSLEAYILIFAIETVLSVAITCFCWYRYKDRSNLPRLTGLLFFIGFLCNSLGYLFARLRLPHLINIPPSLYDPVALFIISLIYNGQTKGKFKSIFFAIAIGFLVVALTNLIFIQRETITSYTKLLSSLIIIAYSLFYFYQLLMDAANSQFQRSLFFWLNSAFLVYHSGVVILFAFTTYLINVLNNNMVAFMSFHNFLSIVSQLIILVGLRYDLYSLPRVQATQADK